MPVTGGCIFWPVTRIMAVPDMAADAVMQVYMSLVVLANQAVPLRYHHETIALSMLREHGFVHGPFERQPDGSPMPPEGRRGDPPVDPVVEEDQARSQPSGIGLSLGVEISDYPDDFPEELTGRAAVQKLEQLTLEEAIRRWNHRTLEPKNATA